MWNHILNHIAHRLLEEGTSAGLKKVSELTGKKAKQIEAATQMAAQFLAALKGGGLELAKAYCNAGLLEQFGEKGMEHFFMGVDLRSAGWEFTTVDDSSKANKWGNINEVKLIGELTDIKTSFPPGSGDAKLTLNMSKEGDGWKVAGISLFGT